MESCTTEVSEEEMASARAAPIEVAATWSCEPYTPLALRSGPRAALVLFVTALILALSLTLMKSQKHEGLMTINGDGYWPLLWQSLPALFMLVVSLYASSSDMAIRSRATLSTLLQPRPSFDIDTSLLDMVGVRVIEHSIRLGIPAVTLSQLLAAACGFLPIISSMLLTTESIPNNINITIEPDSWFGTRLIRDENIERFAQNRKTISDLILLRGISNFTSPQHTYLDLLFPSFHIGTPSWTQGASAKVRTSAARLLPTCTQLSRDQDFYVDSTLTTRPEVIQPFTLHMLQYFECPDGSRQNSSWSFSFQKIPGRDSEYLAHLQSSPSNPGIRYFKCNNSTYPNEANPSWFDAIYTWGEFSLSRLEFEHLSVWNCNYSWADVATDLNLLWSEDGAMIDHNKPPVWHGSSSRPWTPPFGVPAFDSSIYGYNLDDSLPSVFHEPGTVREHDYGVQGIFEYILEPYGQLTLEDLSRSDKNSQVLDTLHSTMAFAAAQLANVEQRLRLDEASDSVPNTAPDQTSRRPITGTITNNRRQRVVQSQAITYTLIAILSLTAAIHIWALISDVLRPYGRRPWLLDLELRGVASHGFSSIAMMRSLLHDSNCSSVLPKNAHLMSAEELHSHSVGREFRLGWFHDAERGSDVYTVGVENAGNFKFKNGAPRLE